MEGEFQYVWDMTSVDERLNDLTRIFGKINVLFLKKIIGLMPPSNEKEKHLISELTSSSGGINLTNLLALYNLGDEYFMTFLD